MEKHAKNETADVDKQLSPRVIAARKRTKAPDAAARFSDGGRRGGAGGECDWRRAAGGPRLGEGELGSFVVQMLPEKVRPQRSLVKVLYDTLSPKQRETICFAWDYQDPKRGLLRTRVANNWNVTEQFIATAISTPTISGRLSAASSKASSARNGTSGSTSNWMTTRAATAMQNSIAIFGHPGADKFEFVMTGRHMTIRCDGHSADHVAFGGPIFYGHAAARLQRKGDAHRQRVLAAGRSGEQAVSNARQAAAEASAC